MYIWIKITEESAKYKWKLKFEEPNNACGLLVLEENDLYPPTVIIQDILNLEKHEFVFHLEFDNGRQLY